MSPRSLLITATLFASSAIAAPTIDPQFGDHAVIQRGKPVLLSGTAAPREKLSVSFAGTERAATADARGIWLVEFPSQTAGGPFSIKVVGGSGIASASDVKLGDVWLCS